MGDEFGAGGNTKCSYSSFEMVPLRQTSISYLSVLSHTSSPNSCSPSGSKRGCDFIGRCLIFPLLSNPWLIITPNLPDEIVANLLLVLFFPLPYPSSSPTTLILASFKFQGCASILGYQDAVKYYILHELHDFVYFLSLLFPNLDFDLNHTEKAYIYHLHWEPGLLPVSLIVWRCPPRNHNWLYSEYCVVQTTHQLQYPFSCFWCPKF